MAKQKSKKQKSETGAKKKEQKTNIVADTFRAIREEAKAAITSGGRRPLQKILALVETGLKGLSGKDEG